MIMARLQRGLRTCAFIMLACCSSVASANWLNDLNEARREAERLNRPILCHFGAEWCAPCRKMETTVFTQPTVIDHLKASAICVKIDVDKNPELARRFGVDRFPMDIIIEPSGQRLMESTGFQSAEDYIALVDRASRRYSDLIASRQPKQAATAVSTTESAVATASDAMLEGYCPVTLQTSRQWEKGSSKFVGSYKDQTFHFVSDEARQKFLQSPEQYAPQFLGCDPVLLFTADRAVGGTIEWGAYFDDRLYLFTNEDNRRSFKQNPEKYVRTKIVLEPGQIETTFR